MSPTVSSFLGLHRAVPAADGVEFDFTRDRAQMPSEFAGNLLDRDLLGTPLRSHFPIFCLKRRRHCWDSV